MEKLVSSKHRSLSSLPKECLKVNGEGWRALPDSLNNGMLRCGGRGIGQVWMGRRRAGPPRGEENYDGRYGAMRRAGPRPGVDGSTLGRTPYGKGESRRYAAMRRRSIGQVRISRRRAGPPRGEENHDGMLQ